MKLLVLCAVLGMVACEPAPDATATAFASATSYKYPLPGGYASFSSHTPYAAAHVSVASMEKDKSSEAEEKKEYEKPDSAPYSYPFLKTYSMEDKDAKIPFFYTYPFQYKVGDKIYYVPSPIDPSMADKTKEETHYEASDKKGSEEKHEDKTPVVYMPPIHVSVDPSEKIEEKKQVYYYTFPGYNPFNNEKSEEKKQVYYYPYTFPAGFKYDFSDKSDEKKSFYYYPFTYPTGFKDESSDKSDEKKPLYYYPYTFPTTFDWSDKADVKTPFVFYSSPSYSSKTDGTYKVPTYTPQYQYYHSY